MKRYHTTKTLVGSTSKGGNKYWIGHAVEDGGQFYTQSEFWQEAREHQFSTPTLVEGKNLGKRNEVPPREQAKKEVDAEFVLKGKKMQVLGTATEVRRVLPMLAAEYNDRHEKGKLVWPMDTQAKLDGMRVVTDGKHFWTRSGNLVDEHIVAHLQHPGLRGRLADAELMLPLGKFTFQETISAKLKYHEHLTPHLQLNVFDLAMTDATPWVQRKKQVIDLFAEGVPEGWLMVKSKLVRGESEVDALITDYIEQGYEGVMFRTLDGVYKAGYRSVDLLKKKLMDEKEFTIVGFEESKGSWAGTPKFIVELPSGITVPCNPPGGLEYRKRLFGVAKSLIGKPMTVIFQGYTDDGSLRFPRGKIIRDYE